MMGAFGILATNNPMIFVLLIITLVLNACGALISSVNKEREPLESAIGWTAIIWICAGIGYVMTLGR